MRRPIDQDRPAVVHGVPGHGHDSDVARIEHRRREVGDPLLGPEQRMQLGERIHREAEPPPHVVGRRLAERREAQLEGVAAHRGVLRRAGQRFDRHAGRRQVGVTRSHVDEVHALLDQPAFDRGKLRHRVGRQPRDTLAELGHSGLRAEEVIRQSSRRAARGPPGSAGTSL